MIQLLQWHFDIHRHAGIQAREIKIKTSPKIPVVAGGTALGKGPVKIRLRPRTLRVIVPKKGVGLEVPGLG